MKPTDFYQQLLVGRAGEESQASPQLPFHLPVGKKSVGKLETRGAGGPDAS